MNVYILLEKTVNQMLFFLFFLNFSALLVVYGILTKCVARVIEWSWKSKLRSVCRLSKQTNGLHPHSSGSKDVITRG